MDLQQIKQALNAGDCPQLREFITGYIECLLWSSSDDNGESLEFYNLSKSAHEKCVNDCREFITGNLDDLQEYAGALSWGNAGHDFWLTRNGHGAGFWDRGLDALGERLTKAAHDFGGIDPYLNDDTNEVEI